MNFKKLTTESGNEIFVNLDLVTELRWRKTLNVTHIYFDHQNQSAVIEKPEEILKKSSF